MNQSKMIFSLSLGILVNQAFADQITINNNNSTPPNQPQQVVAAAPQCPPANQNNIYDPRVPPAGVYRNRDSTTYTTGEKKPYITDNNCNSGMTTQPYVYAQPPAPSPLPPKR